MCLCLSTRNFEPMFGFYWMIRKYFVLDYDFIREAIVSDAKVFVISPVSNNSFIESVKLRSIRKARFKFEVDILRSFAISSKVESSLWSFFFLPLPISPFLYPHNRTYSSATFHGRKSDHEYFL